MSFYRPDSLVDHWDTSDYVTWTAKDISGNPLVPSITVKSSTWYSGQYDPPAAFVTDNSAGWYSDWGAGFPQWLEVDLGANYQIDQYVIDCYYHSAGMYDWTLQGWKNGQRGGDPDILDTKTGKNNSYWAGGPYTITPDSPGVYRYLRFYCTAGNYGPTGYVGISKLDFNCDNPPPPSTSIKLINKTTYSNIKTINNIVLSNVKSINGLQ